MLKKSLFFLSLSVALFASNKDLISANNFLEISERYMQVNKVQNKIVQSRKLLDELEMINFSMSPIKKVIRTLDELKVHYAYPLKIYLPKNTTITHVLLSNSNLQPTVSQNMIYVSVDKDFLSGLLDIFYVYNNDKKSGKSISIKLDRYIANENNLVNQKLYTQVEYYKNEKLSFDRILASLKPFEYGLDFSQIKYENVIYNIKLVNIVENGKILKENMDSKYINCSISYGNREYNYYVY